MHLRSASFTPIAMLFLFALMTPLLGADRKNNSGDSYLVYVGTYTGPVSKGIYAFQFDTGSDKATSLGLMTETVNPSFLAIDPSKKFLYAVNEISNYEGKKSGSITAFAIDGKSGKLAFLNRVASGGSGPCYLSLDRTGKHVLVTNYDSGSVAVFPVLSDGRLGNASATIQHSGHGPDTTRQTGPHPHEIEVSPDSRFALVTDLGLDEVLTYHFDPAKGSLDANDPPFAKVAPGSGPRHFVFDSNGKFVYVLNELNSTVGAYTYEAGGARLSLFATVSTLPESFTGTSFGAEIAMHPNGKFLYASNHGHDSIAIFAIDESSGRPRFLETVLTGGVTPRHFEIAPGGSYLFAENQESNNIVIFKIDQNTGHLTPTGQVLDVPAPSCVKFTRLRH